MSELDIVERLIVLRDGMTERRDRDILADACNEIERLRADMDQITGFLAGVDTVHTEDGALAGINSLPSVQAAWVRGLGSDE